MNQPRWNEIARMTLEGLELAIATKQAQVIEAEAELKALESFDKNKRFDDETDVQFELRQKRMDEMDYQVKEALRKRTVILEHYIEAYEKALRGENRLGEKTGSLIDVAGLFERKKDEPR